MDDLEIKCLQNQKIMLDKKFGTHKSSSFNCWHSESKPNKKIRRAMKDYSKNTLDNKCFDSFEEKIPYLSKSTSWIGCWCFSCFSKGKHKVV